MAWIVIIAIFGAILLLAWAGGDVHEWEWFETEIVEEEEEEANEL